LSLRERFERLEDREKKLLGILGIVAVVGGVLIVPLGVAAALHSERTANQELRDAILALDAAKPEIDAARVQQKAIEARYANQAPPLAAYLSKVAAEVEIEIPESQDRQAVPHGKRYEERSTKITIRKTGMLKIAKFMEKIAQSGHPVSITQLSIRKRSVEPDSYDVDMIVSAFDRKADKPKAKPGTPKPDDSAGEVQK
jgi:general secretion pathway protein M